MEMLHYDFMQRAFCAGGLIALIASVLGVYFILRRQALMADMLSHVSLAGVAAGALLNQNPAWSGFAVAVIGAIAVELVRRSYASYSELAVAIIMIGGLSSAVVMMGFNQGLNKGFTAYLFGSVVTVTTAELWLMLLVSIFGGLFFYCFRRPLYLLTFDEETAKTNGVRTERLSLCFNLLAGMIVAAAMPIVGALLVSSLIVLPAALAIRIAPSFAAALLIAMGTGLAGVFTGLTASYELGTPPGGTIALVLLLFLIVGLAIKRVWLKAVKIKNQTMGGTQ